MTIVDVETDADPVRLHLGGSPIHLPEPVADLARLVVSNRKGHATIGALTLSIWLFPGGQPGRPISTGQLTQRLNRLGIHTDVAVSWQRLSAGDWANYAAEVCRRPPAYSRNRESGPIAGLAVLESRS
jgi:hypothetical protein